MTDNKNNYAVIMAGGIGSRFWPMSTQSTPKQFLDILGVGETLLQQTFRRLSEVVPSENIYIVTNELYSDITGEQLPQVKDYQVLCEPLMRNTAPCIAYACYKIQKRCPDAAIVVAPSDHHITNEKAFTKDVSLLLDSCHTNDKLYTLGIPPSRPDTGYGYIQFVDSKNKENIHKVKTFTEKPNLDLAKAFIESGDFLWNSGIFVWSARSIVEAFEKYLPEIHEAFKECRDFYYTDQEKQKIEEIYPSCQKESIDFGVMEKATNVYVLPASFGWSDLGTWRSLYDKIDKDTYSNAVVRGDVHFYKSEGNVVCSDSLMIVKGMKDFIIANANGVVLICPKDDEQSVKEIVADLKAKGIDLGL